MFARAVYVCERVCVCVCVCVHIYVLHEIDLCLPEPFMCVSECVCVRLCAYICPP